jgi:hypothetical protein
VDERWPKTLLITAMAVWMASASFMYMNGGGIVAMRVEKSAVKFL